MNKKYNRNLVQFNVHLEKKIVQWVKEIEDNKSQI